MWWFFVVLWGFLMTTTVVFRLKPLDIEVMKRLGTRVNLIPVIAKADTLTQNDLMVFKRRVRLPLSSPIVFSLASKHQN